MAEFEFIAWLRRELAGAYPAQEALPVPPGDDCAVVANPAGESLYAADMLMEGVHFDLARTTPELAGRKALAVNLSDIAAMAGTPTSVTVCLALPRRGGTGTAERVMRGVIGLAKEFGVAVAGGDTNSWDGPLVVSVAILGAPHAKGSVTRGGARVGDLVCVTGELGGSYPSGRHLTFPPRVKEAMLLHERYGLNAMIDLSDGLGSDLRHVLKASGVGARIVRGAIPVAAALKATTEERRDGSAEGLAKALSDGEDFELCFTLPADAARRLAAEQPLGVPVSIIGEITREPGLVWEDGAPVTETGYRHALD